MEKKITDKIIVLRYWLRMSIRMLTFLILLSSLIFIFLKPSVGLYAWVCGVFSYIIAWNIPWLGGILMILSGAFGLNLLPGANWDYWGKLPFYVFINAFFTAAFFFILVSILEWITRIEWPFKKPES